MKLKIRIINENETKACTGSGAFSNLVSLGFLAVSVAVGFTLGGPAGAAVCIGLWGAEKGANALYDAANKDRDKYRVENYDYNYR